MVTRGQRRIGKTIRKLEQSVELSSKETIAKQEEKKFKLKAQNSLGFTEDSPVQNLQDPANWKNTKKVR